MKKKEIRSRECLLFNVLLALMVLYSTSVFGATLRVPGDYPTIQAGINAAADGDIVIVSNGTYEGSGNKDLDFNGKSITVRSENGPENCVIDCQGNGRGFYFHSGENRSSVLSGFTITNGDADRGGGIRCSSSPTITNCKIIGNTAEYGGGIYCNLGEATITNCIIIDNTAIQGGGIRVSGKAKITNCTITGNKADPVQGGGIYTTAGSTLTITNCIIWGNNPNGLFAAGSQVSYCDIDRHPAAGSNINSNPLFVDVSDPVSTKWDLHLLPSSPCIDAGSNAVPGLPASDFEGDPRIIDGDGDGRAIADIGADEYTTGQPQPCVARFIANPTSGMAPLMVRFTDQSTGKISSRNWNFGDNNTSTDMHPVNTYKNAGSYTVRLTVHGPGCSETDNKINYIVVSEAKAMPWIPLLLLQESRPAWWNTIMSENYEGIFPSGSWEVWGNPTWGVDDYKPHSGSKSIWCARGGGSGLDPATNNYPNNMNALMICGPFDLSDATEAELIFNCWREIEENNDYFRVLFSTNRINFFGYKTDKSTNGWVEESLDLRSVPTLGNLCGESQVWIEFMFSSNSSGTYKGVFVDDLLLRKKK